MNVHCLLEEINQKRAESRAANRKRTNVLLREITQRVTTLRQARRRFADQLAPDFHLFDYLRTDEFGLSRCLADLLDSKNCDNQGKHGQGGLFLDTLIQQLAPNVQTLNLLDWASADRCNSVALEQPTISGRRIDILLKFNGGGLIGIENKPWAVDQKNQLADYAEYLAHASTHNRWLLVFLSNREPSNESLDKELREDYERYEHFLRLDYASVNAWLQSATEKTRSIKVRFFVEELIRFIQTQVSGEIDMSEKQEVKDSILSSSENLEAAYLVAKTFDDVKSSLVRNLRTQICTGLAGKPYHLVFNEDFFNGRYGKEIEIAFCSSTNMRCRLVFGFEENRYRSFYFGIRNAMKGGLAEKEQGSIRDVMLRLYGCGEKGDSNYPWYIYGDDPHAFGTGCRHWQDAIEPWKALRDGSLAARIIQIVETVYEAFQEDGRMLLLCSDAALQSDAE